MLDVLVIGAGFAGIVAAIKLRKQGIENFTVFEKSNAIGGTWYHNTYPGAACDVPSHFYCYSFAPNAQWSRKFAPQTEILTYLENCVDTYGVREYIQLNKKITHLRFDDEKKCWQCELADGTQVSARHVINAMGGLHQALTPKFAGQDDFTGVQMHSAHWDHGVSFEGKNVCIIGSAASAIQIIPELAKTAKRLTVFQRTPNYVAPRYDRAFTAKEKKRFQRLRFWHKLYRWFLYKRMDVLLFPLTKNKSKVNSRAAKGVEKWMRSVVKNEDLQDKMVPNYTIGCKRILLSDNFYSSLNAPNVELVTVPIAHFTKTGVATKDKELYQADIIVYATGYDVMAHMRSIEIVGSGGVSLVDLGFDGEVAYKGVLHSQFPNYYMVTGPNTGVGTTSVVHMIEVQIAYIMRLITYVDGLCARENTKVVLTVKEQAMNAYNERIQDELADSVWHSGCSSWYQREDGKIVTLYPGSAKDFARSHKGLDEEDYQVIS